MKTECCSDNYVYAVIRRLMIRPFSANYSSLVIRMFSDTELSDTDVKLESYVS
jgi:hypothetical protein